MTTEIKLVNIAVHARHGVRAEERFLGQRFFVDITCRLPEGHRPVDEDLSTTVDYAALFKVVQSVCSERTFRLIESLGAEICDRVLERFPLVVDVAIEIRKPAAPIEGVLDHAAVAVRKSR
ncbi:putative dihydroneopterin aldolase [mine drainage metagenome]|uniref:dihydroneopterin aldolase n=1 Tax=mine drainage metagenome TaxID=410659 RepID=A0A1J5R2A9_9ZZZZ